MLGRNRGKGLRFHPVADVVSHSPGLAVRETTQKEGDFPLRPSQSYKLKPTVIKNY